MDEIINFFLLYIVIFFLFFFLISAHTVSRHAVVNFVTDFEKSFHELFLLAVS